MQQAFVLLAAIFLMQGVSFAQLNEDETDEVPSTHVPRLLSTVQVMEITQGQSTSFPCDVDDLGDYVIMWKRENNRMLFAGDLRIIRDDRLHLEGSTLHVSNVQPKDSGEYICQISTNPGIELTHSLDVLYPPIIRSRTKDAFITAKEGESVTLICDATGNPAPRITWKHANRNYDSLEDGTYVINNAQRNDSGEYECTADNLVGDADTAVISVDIVSAPKITTEPSDGVLVVRDGEPISISCDATGDPKPVITWKKPNADKMIKVHDGKIMISKATHLDAGTYECTANNSQGISTTALIRVQVLYAPKVQMLHARIHASEGDIANITCVVEGEPGPTVTWTKEGATVHHSNDHHLKVHGHTHMLIIRNIKETDFGIYECMARNTLSSASGSTHLMGTPQVSIFTSKPHGTQGTKYTVSWKINFRVPADEYSLMYRKTSAEEWETRSVPAEMTTGDMGDRTEMFQLMDLEPNTEYEATVKARNKFGWSEESDPLIFTTGNGDKQMGNLSSSSPAFSISISILLMLAIFIRQLH